MINRTKSNRAATALPMEICSTLMGGASVETLAVSLSSSFPYFIRTTLAITSSTQNVTINTAMSRNTTTDTFAKMRSSILLATWYDVTQGQNPVMKHHRKFLRHPHNFVDQVSSANFFTETNDRKSWVFGSNLLFILETRPALGSCVQLAPPPRYNNRIEGPYHLLPSRYTLLGIPPNTKAHFVHE